MIRIRLSRQRTVYRGLSPVERRQHVVRCTLCKVNPREVLEPHVPFLIVIGPGRFRVEHGRLGRRCRECRDQRRNRERDYIARRKAMNGSTRCS